MKVSAAVSGCVHGLSDLIQLLKNTRLHRYIMPTERRMMSSFRNTCTKCRRYLSVKITKTEKRRLGLAFSLTFTGEVFFFQ